MVSAATLMEMIILKVVALVDQVFGAVVALVEVFGDQEVKEGHGVVAVAEPTLKQIMMAALALQAP
jgi:hypothetical protein